MSQGVIPLTSGGGGAAVRGYINVALQRLQTRASGTARPSDIAAGEPWFETDNPGFGVWSLWLYDGTTDALLGLLDTTAHTYTPIVPTQAVGDASTKAASTEFVRNNTWTILGTAEPSSAPSVDFVGIPATINHLMCVYELIVGTDNVDIGLQTYDSGGNLDTGATDYATLNSSINSTPTTVLGAAQGSSIFLASDVDNGTFGLVGRLTAANIQASTFTKFLYQSAYLNQAGSLSVHIIGSGWRQETDRITGLRIVSSLGTITGKVTLMGAV